MGNHVHLTGIKEMTAEKIESILHRADHWARKPGEQSGALRGRFVANLFFEPSTRTRFSFEVAEKRLGAHVLNFAAEASSTTKGETIYDTLHTLEAMGVEAAVIRTRHDGLVQHLSDQVGMCLINAGDGTNEHPTQCLLDLLTMKQRFDRIDGLRVAIIGDIRHSRVAGSHLHALPRLGAELLLAGPPSMMPSQDLLPAGVRQVELEQAVEEADVVMMLRVQLERHTHSLFTNADTYHQAYGLTLERAARMKPEAVIMHPAPVNRGVEIHSDLVESEKSLITAQVSNGVAVRMAVLEYVLNGGEKSWESCLQTANF
ncbi:aspartate carbamoyltransferase catalytic subunit [Brevibacillus humidisoli]|uniref:aspartate carbamoyltransferase catalytic subunit n=1 Tax=Brevibacillus humidisoli TaxID=2895522 RepID=UPI001E4292AA|nr:aspartate carbamoyltransferase catalytic subunit [Brevibacillus humidisoli]UFJ41964.1 aspartate carbamoyltransferase catalytic subunit [Brevibacillus humidisoli]